MIPTKVIKVLLIAIAIILTILLAFVSYLFFYAYELPIELCLAFLISFAIILITAVRKCTSIKQLLLIWCITIICYGYYPLKILITEFFH